MTTSRTKAPDASWYRPEDYRYEVRAIGVIIRRLDGKDALPDLLNVELSLEDAIALRNGRSLPEVIASYIAKHFLSSYEPPIQIKHVGKHRRRSGFDGASRK